MAKPSVNLLRFFGGLGTFFACYLIAVACNYAALFSPIFFPIATALITLGVMSTFGIVLGIEVDPMVLPGSLLFNNLRGEIPEANTGTYISVALNFIAAILGYLLGGLSVSALSGPLPVGLIAQNATGGTLWTYFFVQMIFVFFIQIMFLFTGVWHPDGHGSLMNRYLAHAGISFVLYRLTRSTGNWGLDIAFYVHAGTAGPLEDWGILVLAYLAAVVVAFLLFWFCWTYFLPKYINPADRKECCVYKDSIRIMTEDYICLTATEYDKLTSKGKIRGKGMSALA